MKPGPNHVCDTLIIACFYPKIWGFIHSIEGLKSSVTKTKTDQTFPRTKQNKNSSLVGARPFCQLAFSSTNKKQLPLRTKLTGGR